MPKVIIVPSERAFVEEEIISAERVITWLESLDLPATSYPVRQWNGREALSYSNDESTIILQPQEEFQLISIDSIVRLENHSYETRFHLESGEYFTSYKPLNIMVDELKQHQFFLIHPNHLINIKHLKTFVQCNAFVTLSNSDAIPVSVGNDQQIVEFLSKQTII